MISAPPLHGLVVGKASNRFEPWWIRWFNQAQAILQNLQNYGILQYEQPSSGFSLQIEDNVGILILDPSGALATGIIALPVNPVDKQQIHISTTNAINAVTFTSDKTISNRPSSLSAGSGTTYYYRQSDDSWYLVNSPGSGSSTPSPPAPSPTTSELTWLKFSASSDTSGDDPGSGRLSWNDADVTLADFLYVSYDTYDSVSAETFLANVANKGYVYIQQSDDSTVWQLYKITSKPSDLGDYFEIGVEFQSGTTSAADGSIIYANFSFYNTDLLTDDFVNQGTTTTVLHGNASGPLSFGKVALGSDISGNLPVTHLNNGTGATSTTFWNGDGIWADPLDADLTAIKNMTALGFVERYADGVWLAHTLSGTAGRLSVVDPSPGLNGSIVFDIDAAYVGQTSITTLGTVATGTWQATAVGAVYGGTGLTSYTTGDLLYASSSTALSKLADVATGNALISGGVGTAPSWGKIDLSTHTTASGDVSIPNGNLSLTTLGKSLRFAEGSNAVQGTVTLVAGTATVNTTAITANSRTWLSIQSLGTVTAPTTVGETARTPGTSFTITSANATDTSVIAWKITEPA